MIGLLQCRQYRLDPRQVVRARFREFQPSRGARDQGRTHLPFELAGDARCGGLGKAEIAAGSREASRATDPREKPKSQEPIAHVDPEYVLVAAPGYRPDIEWPIVLSDATTGKSKEGPP